MTISYEEALTTLQSMFSPQGYTQQQLDTILRHHGGHMENTVECILVHGDGMPEELIRTLTSSTAAAGAAAGGAVNNIDADEELARQLAAEDRRSTNNGTNGDNNNYARTTTNNAAAAAARKQQLQEQRRPMASTVTVTAPKSPSRLQPPQQHHQQQLQAPAGTKGRGAYTTLPSDFLRIPGRNYPASSTTSSSSTAASTGGNNSNSNEQLFVNSNGMTDEQLARMLQDELFQEELRNNPEFSHLAHHGGHRRGGRGVGGSAQQQQQQRLQQQQQGPDLLEKLSELGDVAKNRFQAFAAGWNSHNSTFNNNGGGGGLFGGRNTTTNGNGGNPSPRGNERRGLLSDLDMDEEEEEMEFIGGTSGGRDVELQSVGRSGDKKTD
mmetsp:Transcript_12900/g.19892  ORF Transcript_12900/g.19892 Transcript_12900/m.19892 type:complete len:381 (+) Transcript_12900:93-1235(+)|eukprot:CAMPEP_0201730506 /NCGR_PEP_ID=MMETSP0593-20130828/22401_1 /ASSEMBLY_ACC=CAM_ASM_000672 /TAXON_ID=267983 /ORGANISM="Skeletonema japonicum, Strain CCMP2506" /LENGTH=380 /DNA_ID=CAMNT_0048223067 /DNA_START=32 /DNA_END=1174 /DNA_ORIENTATION=+